MPHGCGPHGVSRCQRPPAYGALHIAYHISPKVSMPLYSILYAVTPKTVTKPTFSIISLHTSSRGTLSLALHAHARSPPRHMYDYLFASVLTLCRRHFAPIDINNSPCFPPPERLPARSLHTSPPPPPPYLPPSLHLSFSSSHPPCYASSYDR